MHIAAGLKPLVACDDSRMPGRGRPPVNPRLLMPWARRMRALVEHSTKVKNRSDLLKQVGLDPSNFYKYEQGYNDPKIKDLVEIAEKLGVTLDQLYPTKLMSEEPQHEGWRKFKASELGRSMTVEEFNDMAAIRFRDRLPTAEFYQLTLIGYRSHTVAAEPEYPELSEEDKTGRRAIR